MKSNAFKVAIVDEDCYRHEVLARKLKEVIFRIDPIAEFEAIPTSINELFRNHDKEKSSFKFVIVAATEENFSTIDNRMKHKSGNKPESEAFPVMIGLDIGCTTTKSRSIENYVDTNASIPVLLNLLKTSVFSRSPTSVRIDISEPDDLNKTQSLFKKPMRESAKRANHVINEMILTEENDIAQKNRLSCAEQYLEINNKKRKLSLTTEDPKKCRNKGIIDQAVNQVNRATKGTVPGLNTRKNGNGNLKIVNQWQEPRAICKLLVSTSLSDPKLYFISQNEQFNENFCLGKDEKISDLGKLVGPGTAASAVDKLLEIALVSKQIISSSSNLKLTIQKNITTVQISKSGNTFINLYRTDGQPLTCFVRLLMCSFSESDLSDPYSRRYGVLTIRYSVSWFEK